MAQDRKIAFRGSAELFAQLETAAAARGVKVSAYLRSLSELATGVDEGDSCLLSRLEAGDEGATAELLALNPVSLVHRYCLSDEASASLVLRYTSLASPEAKDELICALLGAVDRLTDMYPQEAEVAAAADASLRHLQALATTVAGNC